MLECVCVRCGRVGRGGGIKKSPSVAQQPTLLLLSQRDWKWFYVSFKTTRQPSHYLTMLMSCEIHLHSTHTTKRGASTLPKLSTTGVPTLCYKLSKHSSHLRSKLVQRPIYTFLCNWRFRNSPFVQCCESLLLWYSEQGMCHTAIPCLFAQFISCLQLTLYHESGLCRVEGKGACREVGMRGREGGREWEWRKENKS